MGNRLIYLRLKDDDWQGLGNNRQYMKIEFIRTAFSVHTRFVIRTANDVNWAG